MANGTQVDTAETTNEQPAGADAPAGARRPRPTVNTAGPSAPSPAATGPDTALETEPAETGRAADLGWHADVDLDLPLDLIPSRRTGTGTRARARDDRRRHTEPHPAGHADLARHTAPAPESSEATAGAGATEGSETTAGAGATEGGEATIEPDGTGRPQVGATGGVRLARRAARRQRRRARHRRQLLTAATAVAPWGWFVLRSRGGMLEFGAVVWPVATAAAALLALVVAAALRKAGPLIVGLSITALGLVGLLMPWRPISGGTIVDGSALRIVSTNIAHQDAVELAAALHAQDADVVVLTELSVGMDEAMLRTYPYFVRTDGALDPWEPDTLTVEERQNQAQVGVYSRYPLEVLDEPTSLQQGLPGARVRIFAPPGPVVLYALHLTKATPDGQDASVSYAVQRNVAGEVRAAVGREQEPVIVAGDLNLVDRQEAFRMFSSGLRDAMRADAWAGPTSAKLSRAWRALLLRIDHVLVSPQLCARDPERFMAPSGDHRGVAVTVGPCEAG